MMPSVKVTVLAAIAAVSLPLFAADPAAYPDKAIKIIVPYPPGGSTDALTRMVAEKLSTAWNQPVVVDNRGGASGMIGSEIAARSPSDGYTLLMTGSGPHSVNVSLFPKIAYDPVKDFVPVALTTTIPLLMVAPMNAPFGTVQEFLGWAKENQGKANYCSIGLGSPSHLAAELFKSMSRIEMTHLPYKGSGPALTDTVAGVCDVMFDSAMSSGPQVKAGKLKALAIATPERVKSWPDLPTVSEAGVPGFSAQTWTALLAPAGTPAPIVAKLNAEVIRILASSEVKDKLESQGAMPGSGSPEDLGAFTDQEIRKWAKVIKDGNIRPE
jgi:tripartite-type tricarboxylate transporter receptor subunit TctC